MRSARELAWHRDSAAIQLFDDLRQDVVFALRTMVPTAGFSVAVVSLALGIGGATAFYSTADWLLNRSPGGVAEPSRLVGLQVADRARPEIGLIGLSFPQYAALLEVQDAFVDLAPYGKRLGLVATGDRTEQVVLEYTTGNYFQLLGLRPALGRFFVPEDDVTGAPPVAVVSYSYWQSAFGGAPDVLERSVRLNGQFGRIVGVAPSEFEGFNLDWNGPTAVWVPVSVAEAIYQADIVTSPLAFMRVVGRLRPDMTLERVRQRASAWITRLPVARSGAFESTDLVATPGSAMRVRFRERAGRFFSVALSVSALLLLSACFGATTFLINRAARRKRELAIRVALGGTRSRLTRQLLTEAAILGLCAAAGGAAVAIAIARAIAPLPRVYLSVPIKLSTEGAIDMRVLLTAVVLALVTALVSVLVPALSGPYRALSCNLRYSASPWTWSSFRPTLRQLLLVPQVAVAVAMAIAAGLYARSLTNIAGVRSPYANADSVLVARLVLSGMTPEQVSAFYRELVPRLNSLPGVISSTLGGSEPLSAGEGRTRRPDRENAVEHALTFAGPDYFATQGVPILAGRDFAASEEDIRSGIIVNEVLAQLWWPGENPVGQALMQGDQPRTVVGVVGDNGCAHPLADPMPCAWVPLRPFTGGSFSYVNVHTQGAPLSFGPALRSLIRDMNRDIAIDGETTVGRLLADRTATERLSAIGSAAAALVGIGLLCIALLGVFLAMVKDSARELAIRIALGAGPMALVRRITTQGLVLLVPGAMLGIVAAYPVGQWIERQLYRVETNDVAVVAGVPGLLVGIGIVAMLYVALTAIRTDPISHLRAE